MIVLVSEMPEEVEKATNQVNSFPGNLLILYHTLLLEVRFPFID